MALRGRSPLRVFSVCPHYKGERRILHSPHTASFPLRRMCADGLPGSWGGASYFQRLHCWSLTNETNQTIRTTVCPSVSDIDWSTNEKIQTFFDNTPIVLLVFSVRRWLAVLTSLVHSVNSCSSWHVTTHLLHMFTFCHFCDVRNKSNTLRMHFMKDFFPPLDESLTEQRRTFSVFDSFVKLRTSWKPDSLYVIFFLCFFLCFLLYSLFLSSPCFPFSHLIYCTFLPSPVITHERGNYASCHFSCVLVASSLSSSPSLRSVSCCVSSVQVLSVDLQTSSLPALCL